MMNDDNNSKTLQAFGSVFRWGSGLLGKSAIVAGLLVVGVLVVAFSLHSDWAKLAAIVLVIAAFLFWYIRVMKFCDNHPAEAMLEGVQWAEHQRLQITAMGFSREIAVSTPMQVAPGTDPPPTPIGTNV